MTIIEEASGRCLCGGVTFVAQGVQPKHHACHCDMCRRWSGSPFFGIEVSSVEFSGAENIVRYTSSEWAERGSCGVCGSGLFYFLKPADSYSISAGVFDDQSGFQLDNEIFIDHKPPGYAFAGNLPAMTEAEVFAKYAPSE